MEGRPSVAVLPFRNLRGTASDSALVDGISADIARSLSPFRNLTVVSPHSSFKFRNTMAPLSEIAKKLGVRYVVQGSVRRAPPRIVVALQLIDALREKVVWGERYDVDVEALFDAQDDMTAQAVCALSVQVDVAERERIRRKPPATFKAYELVLKGQQHVARYRSHHVARARRLFEAALRVDPGYARAHGSLSRTHNLDWRYGWSRSPKRSLDTALFLARASVALDPSDARGHAELGFVHLYRREHTASIEAYKRAAALNPNDADILAEMADALNHAGRPRDALPLFERAMRLNPYYPDEYLWLMAGAHFKLQDYDRVITTVNKMQNMTEGRRVLAASYAYLGWLDKARHNAKLVRRTHPNLTADLWRKRYPDRSKETAEHYIDGLRMAGL